jgi:crotonobetainyl-CoA:carnitine CoA-transferase CaiB-like acyl-CoA transferase
MGNSYTDFLASWTAQLAVIASLIHRSRTGKGMWVDLAMYQVGSSFIGEGILDFAFNGRRTRRMGNRDHTMSPHGCYPCLGQDEWVTIAVRDDRDWEACCQALGQPSLAGDSRFAHPTDRHGHQDELDEIISRWTSTQSQYQIMEALQSAGVPAGPVLNAKALLADPQYRARGFFQPADHADETGLGRKEYVGRGWSLSEAPIDSIKPAPALGEANDYVLSRMLCLNDEEIQRLKDAGTVGDTLADARAPSIVPLERQVELGWISGYDEL